MLNISTIKRQIKYSVISGLILTLIACDGMNEQQMLQKAKTYIEQDNLRAAALELRNTLQKNSANAEARYLLGSINMTIGDYAGAEKEFRSAADAGWNQADTTLQIARIYTNKHSFQKLIEQVQVIDSWPVETRANITGLRALAEAYLNNISQAKNTLNRGRALDKNAVNILSTTAILQLSEKLKGDASDTLKKARALYPNNPEILLIHATNDVKNKKLKRAIDTYEQVISLDPDNIITMNGRQARISLTRLHLLKKNYELAETVVTPLVKSNSNDPQANYLVGLLSFIQGNLNNAENHIRKLLSLTPDNLQAQQLMGKIKYTQKDFGQAEHHLSIYLKATPDNTVIRKLLVNTYTALNQPMQARATLQPILTADPDDTAALILLSQIELKSGNIKSPISALKKAVANNPESAPLRKQLAEAHIVADQPELALAELLIYQKFSNDAEGAQKLSIQAHLQQNQPEKALEIANKLLAKNPEDTNTQVLVGSLHTEMNDDQQARTHFNKALQVQPGHSTATLGLARMERKNGHIETAIKLYTSLVDAEKAGTVPMLELAAISAQQNRNNKMLFWLEKARNSTSKEIRARLILAKFYLKKAQPKKAEIYTREAIKQAPEQTELIILHNQILIAQQRYNEAQPPLKKLVARFPGSIAAQTLLGETFLRQNMLIYARKHFMSALKIEANSFIVMTLLAETELRDGKLDKSLEYAQILQRNYPEQSAGYLIEGDTWMSNQNHNKAYIAYSKAWKKQQSAPLAMKLYSVKVKISNLDQAIKPLLTWLNANPDDSTTRFFLANQYQNEKLNTKAIDEYETILQQRPDDSSLLNNLAWLYSLNGNIKALDMAERAYRFSPANASILDTYGWILVQNNQAEKGISLIEQAKKLIPENLEINYHYAVALIKTGRKDEGKSALNAILKTNKPFDSKNEAENLLEIL